MRYYQDLIRYLLEHISSNDLVAFRSSWRDFLPNASAEELLQALQALNEEIIESCNEEIEQAAIALELLPESKARDSAFESLFDLQRSNSEELRLAGLKHLRNRYPKTEFLQTKLRLVGLRQGKNFQGAIRSFAFLEHLVPRAFVYHNGGWGIAEIKEISWPTETLSLEFANPAAPKEFSLATACRVFSPVSEDHILAKRLCQPKTLREFAKKDPAAFVIQVLKDIGPQTAAELRVLVEPLDLLWPRWWQLARNKLKRSGKVELPKHIQHPFKLIEDGGTEQLERILPTTAKGMIKGIQNSESKEMRKLLEKQLPEMIEKSSPAESLELAILSHQLGLTPEPNLAKVPNLAKNLIEFHSQSLRRKTLELIKERLTNWQEIYWDLFLNCQGASLRELIFSHLQPLTPQHLTELEGHPLPFLWHLKKSLAKGEPLPAEAFFNLLYQKGGDRDLSRQMIRLLSQEHYQLARAFFAQSDLTTTRELLLLASKCHSFTPYERSTLAALAKAAHPQLEEEGNTTEKQPLWITTIGYQKLKERIEQKQIERMANAKEIEKARALGDLRENAEFKSALEKRKEIERELQTLVEQLSDTQILTSVDLSKVGIGTKITCEDSSGNLRTYSFLGPWEADPEKDIFSFQSKFAKSLLEQKIGFEFTFENKPQRIISIESALCQSG